MRKDWLGYQPDPHPDTDAPAQQTPIVFLRPAVPDSDELYCAYNDRSMPEELLVVACRPGC